MTTEAKTKNTQMTILQWLCMGVLITTVTIIQRGTQEDLITAISAALGGHLVSMLILGGTIGFMLILGALDFAIMILGLIANSLQKIIEVLERSEDRKACKQNTSDEA